MHLLLIVIVQSMAIDVVLPTLTMTGILKRGRVLDFCGAFPFIDVDIPNMKTVFFRYISIVVAEVYVNIF